MKKALTIAGSDSGGGAGIQADLKTFMAFGVYGMSAITALTAQNTAGVQGIVDISPDFVREQIRSVMTDIGTDAAKTGMLSNAAIVKAVAEAVREFRIPNLVVDPVMIAKSGAPLLAPEARKALVEVLLPLATVITPNVFEAESILGRRIDGLDAMKKAARELRNIGCQWLVLKGGQLDIESQAVDVLCRREGTHHVPVAPIGIHVHPRERLHIRLGHYRGTGQGPDAAGRRQTGKGLCHRGHPERVFAWEAAVAHQPSCRCLQQVVIRSRRSFCPVPGAGPA